MSDLHVHVVNDPELDPEQFHVHEEQFWTAVAAHPGLRERVTLSISGGDDGEPAGSSEADVLIGWSFPPDLIERAERVRWIHVIGAGVDHLEPFDWVPAGVVVTNSSGVHVPRASEFVACALLMLNNRIPLHLEEQRARRWHSRYSTVIAGKTVLVVGVGTIGGAAARRAKELGLHVRGVRQSGASHTQVDEMFTPDQVQTAIAGVDYVVVCAALTETTRGLIGAPELALLPEHAGLINIARGPIVDYAALARALRAGRLGGAILDVFEPEPLPSDSELWDCPRLVITPHVSSDPLDYTPAMLEIFADNLVRLERGGLRNEIRVTRPLAPDPRRADL